MRTHTVTRLLNLVSMLLTGTLVSPSGSFGQERDRRQALSSTLAKLEWRTIGPAAKSGRIGDLTAVESNPDIVYVATSTGGAWKSTNRGITWEEIFKNRGTASLGAIAVAPDNPNLVWLGSGENWNARSASWGDGVYKSEDGGKSWKHMGLEETRHTGKIVIHPEDPDIVYVAGMGALWGANEQRGVFKTTDGGETWEKVLFVSQYTGVSDVEMDPRDPALLYAAAFQRERRNWSFLGGGPEGGIYRTTDGGATWQELQNGLPAGDVGSIALSVCRSQADTIYAAIRAKGDEEGLYRSDDRGASWERRSGEMAYKLRCDPNNPERVYLLRNGNNVSEDGGRTFTYDFAGAQVHVDQRAMWIDPTNSDHIVIGNDGGVYFTFDRGKKWNFVTNLPVMQFYTVAVDQREPFYYVYGGTQDNNTLGGPSATRFTDGIANEDWFVTVGGDGFHARIDPEDPTIVYSESQYGRLVRFDTETGERRLIQPAHPEDAPMYLWNWSSPLHISHYDNETLYFSANVVFKSADRGDSWQVISPDLTRQISYFDMPMQGKIQPRDALDLHRSTSDYGNITTFSESPIRRGLLAVGSDDGLIHVSRNDGGDWVRAETPTTIPEKTRGSRVSWSQHQEGTLYATFDGHKDANFLPYVYKSTDYGAIWSDITGDLPEFGSTRVIVEHPRNPNLLFVGTESQVFVSITGGGQWVSLKNNMPTVPVHDMVIQPQKNDLVIGTHGRGFWILDDVAILEELSEEVLASDLHLASVRPAIQMHKFNRGRRSLGHSHYTAPNPPDGAILTYYVNPALMESTSTAPKVAVDILHEGGQLLRRLEAPQGPDGAGVQRLVWDLRHPLTFKPGEGDSAPLFRGILAGPFVLPGTYQVRLRAGETEQVRSVAVSGDPAIDISTADRRTWHDTLQTLNQLIGVVHAILSTTGEVEERLGGMRRALQTQADVPGAIDSQLTEIDDALTEVRRAINGEENTRSRAEQRGAPALAEQVRLLYANVESSTALPTADQQRLTRHSQEKLTEQIGALERLVLQNLPALERQLDAAGVPWTPGRTIALPPTDVPPEAKTDLPLPTEEATREVLPG